MCYMHYKIQYLTVLIEYDFCFHSKSTDNDKEAVPNSTAEDGPGDGFTILSAKSLFLGQKVPSMTPVPFTPRPLL